MAIILAAFRTLPPPALSADALANVFSAGRAVTTIEVIARSPRSVGSRAYENAKAYLLTQLESLGLETDVQDTYLDGVRVENVLARLEGTETKDAILLSAHLDTVQHAPGAADDASGVAVILETIRALRTEAPLRNTVIVLFTGPEENRCYGARAFVYQHPWAEDVRLVVNVDAGGVSGPSILTATGPDGGWLIEQAAPVIPRPIASLAVETLGNPATDYTLMFRPAGWLGFDFNLSWSKQIHTPADNIDNLNLDSLQHQGENMLAVVRHFGNIPLEIPRLPRPVYFDILSLTIVHYPVSWAIFILVGLSILMAGVIYRGFKQKCLTRRGIGLGVLAFLLSLLTVPALLLLFNQVVIQPLLRENPALALDLIGDSVLSSSIRWGSTILTLLTTFLWYAWFKKVNHVSGVDLAFGCYILLYACAFGTTVALPALSYLFVWPLLACLLAAFVWFPPNHGKSGQPEWLRHLGLLIAAVIVVALFVPGIFNAMMSLEIQMIYLVPVFVVVMLGFLVQPLLDS